MLLTALEGVSKDTDFSSTLYQAPLVNMMTPLTFVVFLSICLGSAAGYRRALCPTLSCPDAPEHCRQVYNYGWINSKWCPVSCQPVCECPTPAPWDMRHCGNRDPYCLVYRETVDLPDGQRCLIKCLLACFSGFLVVGRQNIDLCNNQKGWNIVLCEESGNYIYNNKN